MKPTLVVMAAGRGSRFGGIKQLAPIGPRGEVLFDFAVYDALHAGFETAVFVVSEESRHAVERHVASGCGQHIAVRFALQAVPEERTKPWGTGEAVLRGSEGLDGPFGVVNADDFYGSASFALLADALANDGRDHVLVDFRLGESLSPNGGVSRGLCEVESGVLKSIVELHEVRAEGGRVISRERTDLSGDELISANLWGFRPSFRPVLEEGFEAFFAALAAKGDGPSAEYLIGDAVQRVLEKGDERIRVVPTPEPFLGITFSADVEQVANALADRVAWGHYPSPLWGGKG